MKLSNAKLILVVMFTLLAFTSLGYAITVDEIIDKVDAAKPDFTTQKAISKMILISKDGKVEEERSMVMYSKKDDEDTTTSLMRFLSPKSVKGVTLLNIKNGEKIYLYMPAYRKPRRIAGSSKSESFMGSDLSYEDMSMDYKDKKYDKKLLKETDTEYVVEVIPNDEDISYDKIIIYVDKEHFYGKKIELYEKGELSKVIEIKKVKIENGKVTPMDMVITNVSTGHKTEIVMESIEYNIKLPSNFFSIRTLKKPKLQ